jgi:T-lymphoma invasion and metastasis-inducing protein 1
VYFYNCLAFKHLQVELARKRGWKGYWVCLKGTTLLFYPCDSQEGRSVEATPKHLVFLKYSIKGTNLNNRE